MTFSLMSVFLDCDSWEQEGWKVLGEEDTEQRGRPEVQTGKTDEGEPDCSEGIIPWEPEQTTESDNEQTQHWEQ